MDHYTGSHVHNHGLLAGLGAGAAAVLGCFLLVLGVWHRVSSAVGTAVTVLVWALVAVFLVAAAFAVGFLFLRFRHHLAHPETLARQAVRAEVIPDMALAADETPAARGPVAALPPPAAQQIPGAGLPAIELARPEIHYHFDSAEAVQAALAARDREGNP